MANRWTRVPAGVGLIALLVVSVAGEQSNPRFGRWRLKSEAPAPQSNIMTYAPHGERGMRVTIDAVSSGGRGDDCVEYDLVNRLSAPRPDPEPRHDARARRPRRA